MPSGTLANHLALRALAGAKRRVIVPETSHIYNDTGDACQTLSALTLMPLGPGAATFTRADVEAVLARTASGRVATDVGAIAIESPVRRLSGQMFDWDVLTGVAALARERGIGLHLDGARIFIASAYTGRSPAEYAAPFDTVYVSLWKYFNSGQGAILAGPRRVLDGMFHTRRMFGGNLAVGWPAALVARHYMDGFVERLRSAVEVSEAFYRAIAAHPRLAVERIPNGTNVARLTLKGVDPALATRRLAERGIRIPTVVERRRGHPRRQRDVERAPRRGILVERHSNRPWPSVRRRSRAVERRLVGGVAHADGLGRRRAARHVAVVLGHGGHAVAGRGLRPVGLRDRAWLTMAVQAGFVVATLGTAMTNLADVVNPRLLISVGVSARRRGQRRGARRRFAVGAHRDPAGHRRRARLGVSAGDEGRRRLVPAAARLRARRAHRRADARQGDARICVTAIFGSAWRTPIAASPRSWRCSAGCWR